MFTASLKQAFGGSFLIMTLSVCQGWIIVMDEGTTWVLEAPLLSILKAKQSQPCGIHAYWVAFFDNFVTQQTQKSAFDGIKS